MTRETIVLQFPLPHTSHVVISKMIDCLIVVYGNPEGGIITTVRREYFYFRDAPRFRDIHDGYGWNLPKLEALIAVLRLQSQAQP